MKEIVRISVKVATPRDLVKIEQIRSNATSGEQLAKIIFLAIQKRGLLIGSVLNQIIPVRSSERIVFVARRAGELEGFIDINVPKESLFISSNPSRWEIQDIWLQFGSERHSEVLSEMLKTVSAHAIAKGVERIFARVPASDPLIDELKRAGFKQYALENIYVAKHPRCLCRSEHLNIRPACPADKAALYHLYKKVTPQGVIEVEAPNVKEWELTYRDTFAQIGQRKARGRHFILATPEVVGWGCLYNPDGYGTYELCIKTVPDNEIASDIVDYALRDLHGRDDVQVVCTLRHYEFYLSGALVERGFERIGSDILLVKELMAREKLKERVLVPQFG